MSEALSNAFKDMTGKIAEQEKAIAELVEALRLANHTLCHLYDSVKAPQQDIINNRVGEFRALISLHTKEEG